MTKGLAILVTTVGTLACLIFIAALSSQMPVYASTYMLIAALTVVIAIPARKILSGETPWWSPHAMVLATMFLYFVVASLAVVYFRVESMAFKRSFRAEELNAGMAVVLVSLIAYLIGYRFGPKPGLLPERLEWFFTDTPNVQIRFNLVTMTLFLVGIGAWMSVFYAAGGIGAHLRNLGDRQESVARAGGIALHLSKWAFVGFFLYFARNGVRISTIVMFSVLMVIYLIFGSRNWVGMFLIGTAVVYRMRFGKIPSIVWVGSAVALMFMQAFLVLLRMTGGDFGRAQYQFGKNLRTTEGTVLGFVGDFAFLRYLADLTVSMGTVVPYQWGKTMLSFLFVIPSFLWSARENIATGPGVYMKYLTPDHIKTVSVGPSLLGEFIINFGWPGVVIMPLILGVIMSWFQSITISNPHRRYQLAFPVMAAVFGPEMLSFIKHGLLDTATFPYLILPLLIPYLPNMTYLTSGPPQIVPARA